MDFKSLYQTIINLDTPLREDNATALKGVYNPAAFQRGEDRRAAELSQSTDPQSGYTSAEDPIDTTIRHSQGSMEGKQGALDSVKQIAMFDDPVKIIQHAIVSGASEQEILQALPQDFDLKSAMANYNPADSEKAVADLMQNTAVRESSDDFIDECGDDTMNTPHQPSSVSMSVSMNGSGKEGIRDLMDVLKNIEDAVHSTDDSDDEPLYSAPRSARSSEPIMGGEMDEEFANTMNTQTMNMDSMFRTGNDMHSKGVEYPKVNGGGNPMQEALVTRLYSMYSTIKETTDDEADKDNAINDPKVQAALKRMSDRHKNDKWSKEQSAELGKRLRNPQKSPSRSR